MEIVGKLTAKTLGWDRIAIGNATKDTTQRVKMGTIVGIVSGLRQTVNAETGDVQSGLKGNFRGTSTLTVKVMDKNADGTDKMIEGKPVMLDTGKVMEVRSGVCYLPSGIQDTLEGALAQAREADPKATVSFGLDLYAVKDTNKAGYTFIGQTLVEASDRDPLDVLMAQAVEKRAALPAPDAEPEADPAPADEAPRDDVPAKGGKAAK